MTNERENKSNYFGFGAGFVFGPPEAFDDDYDCGDENDAGNDEDVEAPCFAACDRAALAAAPAPAGC